MSGAAGGRVAYRWLAMEAVHLEPGEGETIAERDERSVVLKAGTDSLALTESRYAAGESGPDHHVHHRHTDAFYVLAGALVFEVGRERKRVGAESGALVLVPPEVSHTFWADGPGEARFLNVHAPSERFHEMLRASRDDREYDVDFDSSDPPPDGGRPAADAMVRGPGEGETIAVGPSRATFKAEVGDGQGTFSLTEQILAPGFPGAPPHRHETLLDAFYVLDGTLTVRIGDRAAEVRPGGFALAPPGTVHTFSNPGPGPVRSLNVMAPGGFEQYLKELTRASEGGAPDPALIAAIASKYDFHPVEPGP